MLHEKPSDFFHWKNKLEELDHLAEEPVPDRKASWEKLYGRLSEKPQRNRIIWYWVAAACLLLIIGIQWIRVNQKDHKIVYDQRQPQDEQSFNTTKLITENPAVNLKKITIKNKQIAHVAVKSENHFNSKVNITSTDEQVVSTPDTTIETSPVIVNTTNPLDTTALAAAAPVKKKLRVIHINELENQVPEMPFARNTGSHVLKAKYFNQDGFPNFSVSKNSSADLVKIKLALSN